MINENRVVANQLLDILRQILRSRHRCAIDQHRNDPDASRQRDADFQPDEIARQVYAPLPLRGRCVQPVGADDRKENVGAPDRRLDLANEILARRHAVDIDEHILAPHARSQRIRNAPGHVGGIIAPVADEYSGHVRLSPTPGIVHVADADANRRESTHSNAT